MTLGDKVQRIAQMKARNRAARSLEFVLLARRLAGGKHKGRPVQLVLDARGDDAEHAFMEFRVKNRNRRRRLFILVNHGVGRQLGLLAHA